VASQEQQVTQFEVQVVDEAEPVVVRLLGELDLAVADDLADSVKPYLTRGRAVVGDLAGLSFVDSAGLATLVACHKAAKRSGSGFWLRAPGARSRWFWKITGLCDVLSKPFGR